MQIYTYYCNKYSVTGLQPSSTLSVEALREFSRVKEDDWNDALPLAEILERVNSVTILIVAGEKPDTSTRAKPTYTVRSFRHYQTLGCIDAPEKRGRVANYGYRHFIQALLVRRLLVEKVSSEQIATLLGARETDELERMLLGGLEITAKPGGQDVHGTRPDATAQCVETWNRAHLAPGMELHFISKLPNLEREDFKRLITRLKQILRRQGNSGLQTSEIFKKIL